MVKNKDYEGKKKYVAFYLNKKDIDRIEKIINHEDSIFEDRSTLIRYCIKMQLSKIEEELFKTE